MRGLCHKRSHNDNFFINLIKKINTFDIRYTNHIIYIYVENPWHYHQRTIRNCLQFDLRQTDGTEKKEQVIEPRTGCKSLIRGGIFKRKEMIDMAMIFSRGSKYVNAAGWNWTSRKNKFIHSWATSSDWKFKNRLSKTINELDDRLKIMARALNNLKIREERERIEQGQKLIHLLCPNIECNYRPDAVGTAVMAKDYEPDKIKCGFCGSSLVTENVLKRDVEINLAKQLASYKIEYRWTND